MPTKYVTVDGCPIHYWHTGPSTPPNIAPDVSRGAVVAFVHGAGWNAALWQSQLAGLQTDHSPLAFDFPGHGRSGGTEALESIEAYRDCLAGFCAALKLPPVVLVGHDLGGAAALAYAITKPAQVRALVLTGTAARFEFPSTLLDTWREVMRGRRPQPFNNDGFGSQADMAVLRFVLTEQVKTDPRVRFHDLGVCNSFEVTPWLAELHVPTLIVAGREDPYVTVEQAQSLHRGIADSQLAIIDGAGHFVPWEQPAGFQSALTQFLTNLKAPAA
ncbi:MAG: alpha/beta hydrolase [Deltaproteobacteria bacterium]|nr:alpha/beta hydrolase [Deltaproteobacteria bacterium]